jgi:hypothetical protein
MLTIQFKQKSLSHPTCRYTIIQDEKHLRKPHVELGETGTRLLVFFYLELVERRAMSRVERVPKKKYMIKEGITRECDDR